jgi:TetR/AcrR family transcriptional regulator
MQFRMVRLAVHRVGCYRPFHSLATIYYTNEMSLHHLHSVTPTTLLRVIANPTEQDSLEPPSARRLPREERRVQIIAAARDAFLESGFSGTKTREIARRAGITEAFLYKHFTSKEEIYQVAVEAPLALLAKTLVQEVKLLAERQDTTRAQLLERANELLLGAMIEMSPLLSVALFADLTKGREEYQKVLRPLLAEAIQVIVTDISGWDPPRVDAAVIYQGFFGLHYGAAVDGILCERTIDVRDTARQITEMFRGGIREIGTKEPQPRRNKHARRSVTSPPAD